MADLEEEAGSEVVVLRIPLRARVGALLRRFAEVVDPLTGPPPTLAIEAEQEDDGAPLPLVVIPDVARAMLVTTAEEKAEEKEPEPLGGSAMDRFMRARAKHEMG